MEVCLRCVAILYIWDSDMCLFRMAKTHVKQIGTDLKQTFTQTPVFGQLLCDL